MHLIKSFDGAHVLFDGNREGGINIIDENIMTWCLSSNKKVKDSITVYKISFKSISNFHFHILLLAPLPGPQ